jgi:hypothetical protein
MYTFMMQCLGCGIVVKNPRTVQYMYEKCDVCLKSQLEQEERAMDTYLHERAVKELEANA